MMKPLELAVGAVVAIAVAATIADTAAGQTPPADRGVTIRLAQADTAAPAPKKLGSPVRYALASIEKTCGNVTYKLSTGNGKGTCATGVAVAECTDGAGNTARLYCERGCTLTTGSGACQEK
ncbi:hypothetical protein [Phenylobacterium sp.]|jgi:hypothetical protein|uniref:hypothetical protein n=1 Tax=Phenylobacterium sp. TaxID=1871053 RepID=UPI002E35A54B|nr:hypothetical protein [Phenylobacterium sp.]HEX2561332.1 hypothetical protein [Phenylobacterium sp.]